jgi:hypothetical protein
MTADSATQLLNQQTYELFELIRDSDSVELKLTIPHAAQRSTVGALGIDPLDAQIRQVFFFETPDLDLNKAGVVARVRRVQGKGDDSVVKLRPVVPNDLPPELRASPNLVVEVDAMPGGFVCSASLKGRPNPPGIRETLAGAQPKRKLFSKEQRAFFAAHAPDGIELDDLSVLGPIFVLKVSIVPESLKRKMAGELWLYPDGSRILEISTKCAPAETATTVLDVRRQLAQWGIDVTGEQQTKTKTALEFFSKELREGAGG